MSLAQFAGPSNRAAQRLVAAAARRYGISPNILWGVYGTETDYGRNNSTSSAGAVGPFQFLPSTARGMGVNPYDFRSAAFGAAKYLSQYRGRGRGGMLSAYNAGPAGGYQSGYVSTVLAKAGAWNPHIQADGTPMPRLATGIPTAGQARAMAPQAPAGPNPWDIISGLSDSQVNNPYAPQNANGIYDVLAAGWDQQHQQAAQAPQPQALTMPNVGGAGFQTGRSGKVIIAPNANRAGVNINPWVTSAVAGIAGVWGRAITIGTGTRHNQYVQGTHNQSDHWDGNAADLPMSGTALTKFGQAALRFFGQPVDNGGVHTFIWQAPNGHRYRVQVLFNTMVGGNHYTHLHVGVRPV